MRTSLPGAVVILAACLCALVAPARVARAAQPPGPARDAPKADMVPELTPNLGWLNTDRPLRFREELKGHVVILDFWTYCCINCMHVLPDLAYLEEKYKDQPFVVIGVHSAKFDNESQRRSIRNAVQRYNVAHPVVIDDEMKVWRKYGVRGWPTLVVIDSRGLLVDSVSGEGYREGLDRIVQALLDEGRTNGTLAAKPVAIAREGRVAAAGGLAFPGKVLAIPPSEKAPGRLFIADSSHHRVVVTGWPDAGGASELVAVLGDGTPGLIDAIGPDARFHDPQGLAYDASTGTLYVADTKNHAIRAVDSSWRVSTLVGTGFQVYDRKGGRAGRAQGLNSPWDVALSRDRATLYVAMAGPHQLWKIDLATGVAGVLAGSGREAITDGPAGEAALAQPSGLALSSDGGTLYFADSETSAIRALDLGSNRVRTIIGRGLFEFGDVDGVYPDARLQHCLGVALLDAGDGAGADRLLVADTYNHKLKLVLPGADSSATWLGSPHAGADRARDGAGLGRDDAPRLDEPGGVHAAAGRVFVADTNNHRVIVIDATTKAWREVMVHGLSPPGERAGVPEGAVPAALELAPGRDATLRLHADLPEGESLNPESPATVRVSLVDEGARAIAMRTTRAEALPVEIVVPGAHVVAGRRWLVEWSFGSCVKGDLGICTPREASWLVGIEAGGSSIADLRAPSR